MQPINHLVVSDSSPQTVLHNVNKKTMLQGRKYLDVSTLHTSPKTSLSKNLIDILHKNGTEVTTQDTQLNLYKPHFYSNGYQGFQDQLNFDTGLKLHCNLEPHYMYNIDFNTSCYPPLQISTLKIADIELHRPRDQKSQPMDIVNMSNLKEISKPDNIKFMSLDPETGIDQSCNYVVKHYSNGQNKYYQVNQEE